MSSPPPTKPPRGVKQGKETSGLLMSVIRTLSASETNEQREKERAKLEKEYKKSDARLDELVAAHSLDIMEVMQKFSNVGASLSVWGSHCEAAVARLTACRGLLRLRRDDLRRLWADARTHHYALQMLTDIERVVVSEREAREFLTSGRILAAAHTLKAALDTANTTLSHVDALNATRQHLQAKNHELVEVILRRVSDAVYRDERAPLSRRVSARRRTALLLAELTKSQEVTDAYLQDITPEYEASLSEEDRTFETTVMISLEALGVLEQLNEATEKFKVKIQNELLEVIDSVSRRIIEDGEVEVDPEGEEDGEVQDIEGVPETGRPLARLVTNLGEEFKACATRNKRLLQLWRAALQKHRLSDSSLHTEQHYWSAVQQVVQLVLREYMQIESVNRAAQRTAAVAQTVPHELRLTDYFAKKRPQRPHTKLFAFTSAAVAPITPRRATSPLVCRPDPSHLHCVLPALHALCAHIEPLAGGGECSLRAFITDYVRTGESERLAACARAAIESVMRAPAAWRERVTPPQPNNNTCEQHRVIYTCCSGAWRACSDATRAAKRCGPCGGADALRAVTGALATLATHARAAHTRIAPVPAQARAARWLADDDIVRFLQSLPNWRAVTRVDSAPATHELKQAYEREAEILGSSLGDGAITRKEITSDISTLADLAVLCESMDWLSMNINSIPSMLSGSIRLSDKTLNDISAAAAIFDEISHKCLLFLHLEMRIECFYYLGQEDREPGGVVSDRDGDAGRAGGGAGELAHALLTFHEQAANVLSPARLDYVFNGVGEMMSAGVVWRWQGEAGNVCGEGAEGTERGEGGARGAGGRLGALRHCLAALHLPHDGLHRAHNYLHLLNCTPQEIISSVREKGAQFTELEYLNAFKVIGTRNGLSPTDMRHHLKQLSAALGHVGVTV